METIVEVLFADNTSGVLEQHESTNFELFPIQHLFKGEHLFHSTIMCGDHLESAYLRPSGNSVILTRD